MKSRASRMRTCHLLCTPCRSRSSAPETAPVRYLPLKGSLAPKKKAAQSGGLRAAYFLQNLVVNLSLVFANASRWSRLAPAETFPRSLRKLQRNPPPDAATRSCASHPVSPSHQHRELPASSSRRGGHPLRSEQKPALAHPAARFRRILPRVEKVLAAWVQNRHPSGSTGLRFHVVWPTECRRIQSAYR